jgi:Protein of unknown function (DUF2726)
VLNVSEGRVLDHLERSLAGEGYSIFAGLPLKRVIEEDSGDALTYEEKQMLLHGELDFAIVSRGDGNTIVFGIEFDGPYHENPERQAKDRVKDGLCFRAGVPLIRIRPEAIEPKEQITLLEWILDGYLFYRRERKGKIQDLIDYWTDKWRNGDSEFPPGDAAVALHTIVPFPASETIRERLRTRYEIWTQPTIGFPWEQEQEIREGLERFFDKLSAYNEAPLKLIDVHRLHALFPDEDDEDKGEEEVPDDFRLAVVRESEPIYVAEAPIDWSPQPILTQAPAAERIGTWMWAVDVALAEYRAFVRLSDGPIARWCE